MSIDILLVYAVVSFFYVLSPGPAVFLAVSNGMSANMKVVAVSSLANILGLFLLSAISMLGLGAILLSSALLFTIVKVLGAGYLIYLGIKQLLLSRKVSILAADGEALALRPTKHYFFESFFLAVTNPKPILFFVALFPQFINASANLLPQFFILTGIFMAWSFFGLVGYGFLARSAKTLFARDSFMRWFHRLTGGLFIIMGASLLRLKSQQAIT